MSRFLSSVWRNLAEGKIDAANSVNEAIDRQMHRTIKKVAEDIEGLRFNTAIAELIKLNNEITGLSAVPKYLAENLVLMLAPFAPHTAEELWERLGHGDSLPRHPWPTFDPEKLVESTMELPLQVNRKMRGARCQVRLCQVIHIKAAPSEAIDHAINPCAVSLKKTSSSCILTHSTRRRPAR